MAVQNEGAVSCGKVGALCPEFTTMHLNFRLSIFAFIIIFFYGCKKDYNCLCSTPLVESASVIHATKKDAEKACKQNEANFKPQYPDMTCVIE